MSGDHNMNCSANQKCCNGDCNQGRDCPLRQKPTNCAESDNDGLVYRLRKRAQIRRQIDTRKSVQNNEPDRIADLLEESANRIEQLEEEVFTYYCDDNIKKALRGKE
jgi:hypothetical protein